MGKYSKMSTSSREVCVKCNNVIPSGSYIYKAYSGGVFGKPLIYCSEGCARADGHKSGVI